MNRRKFTSIIGGSMLAPLAISSTVKADQDKRQLGKARDAATLSHIKGFDHGYRGCLSDIRIFTKHPLKKGLVYEGIRYVAVPSDEETEQIRN